MTSYTDAETVIAAIPVGAAPTEGQDDYAAIVARLTSLCITTAEMIDAELGADFHRHPSDPYDEPVTRYHDGRGSLLVHVHAGIVELDSVSIRYAVTGDWEVLDAADWELESMFPDEGDRPYDHIRLTGAGRARFPRGTRNVRTIGVHGWAAPPSRLVEANTAWVRQHQGAGDSWSGSMTTPEGPVMVSPRLVMPDDVRILLTRESRRYAECWT